LYGTIDGAPLSQRGGECVQITNAVLIDRPVGDVFAYVSNLNNFVDWATGAIDLHPDMDDVGTFVVLRQISGRRIESRFKVTELTPQPAHRARGRGRRSELEDRHLVRGTPSRHACRRRERDALRGAGPIRVTAARPLDRSLEPQRPRWAQAQARGRF